MEQTNNKSNISSTPQNDLIVTTSIVIESTDLNKYKLIFPSKAFNYFKFKPNDSFQNELEKKKSSKHQGKYLEILEEDKENYPSVNFTGYATDNSTTLNPLTSQKLKKRKLVEIILSDEEEERENTSLKRYFKSHKPNCVGQVLKESKDNQVKMNLKVQKLFPEGSSTVSLLPSKPKVLSLKKILQNVQENNKPDSFNNSILKEIEMISIPSPIKDLDSKKVMMMPSEVSEHYIPAAPETAKIPLSPSSDETTPLTPHMDVYDPLDFELSEVEDISDADLLTFIEDNLDYCEKIYDCNPIYQYILMEQPISDQMQQLSSSFPRSVNLIKLEEDDYAASSNQINHQNKISIPTVTDGIIWIPSEPVICIEDIQSLIGNDLELLKKGEALQHYCSICYEQFTDSEAALYHVKGSCSILNTSSLFE